MRLKKFVHTPCNYTLLCAIFFLCLAWVGYDIAVYTFLALLCCGGVWCLVTVYQICNNAFNAITGAKANVKNKHKT